MKDPVAPRAAMTAYARQALVAAKDYVYDDIDSPVWQNVVYDTLHRGREFTNLGGRQFLDYIGVHSRLGAGAHVLELCSGVGGTCRYLAQKFRIDVTGVEINKAQIQAARQRTAAMSLPQREAIRYVCGDAKEWKSSTRYDVVFVIESLALIDRPLAVLRRARASLKANGRLFVAEVFAGPNLTEPYRQTARREDGMIGVMPVAKCMENLTKIGFTEVSFVQKTALAEKAFRKLMVAVEQNRRTIVAHEGTAGLQRWRQITSFYSECFRKKIFIYGWIRAKLSCTDAYCGLRVGDRQGNNDIVTGRAGDGRSREALRSR